MCSFGIVTHSNVSCHLVTSPTSQAFFDESRSILGKMFVDSAASTDVFGDPSPKHNGKHVHGFPHAFPIY